MLGLSLGYLPLGQDEKTENPTQAFSPYCLEPALQHDSAALARLI
jgi:hypothetical protein